jgi:hypothetical protein
MATRRYMINKGETFVGVTEAVGSATASKNIELTVDFDAPAAEKLTKAEVLRAVDHFKEYITRGPWPPA